MFIRRFIYTFPRAQPFKSHWEAQSCPALMGPEDSLPCSQGIAIQVPGLVWHSVTSHVVRRDVLCSSAQQQSRKATHCLLAASACSVCLQPASYSSCLEAVAFTRNLKTHHAVATHDPLNMDFSLHSLIYNDFYSSLDEVWSGTLSLGYSMRLPEVSCCVLSQELVSIVALCSPAVSHDPVHAKVASVSHVNIPRDVNIIITCFITLLQNLMFCCLRHLLYNSKDPFCLKWTVNTSTSSGNVGFLEVWNIITSYLCAQFEWTSAIVICVNYYLCA
jgi:hypothetical protein